MTLAPVKLCLLGAEEPVHILIDSTGLKVHRVRASTDKRNRRPWRKVHLVVDANTGDILASELTTRRASDCAQAPNLLAEITGELASVMADGANDTRRVYSTVEARPSGRRTKIHIPPRSNARPPPRTQKSTESRDHTIQLIDKLGMPDSYCTGVRDQAAGEARPETSLCNKAPFCR
jgi:hypothetical protein